MSFDLISFAIICGFNRGLLKGFLNISTSWFCCFSQANGELCTQSLSQTVGKTVYQGVEFLLLQIIFYFKRIICEFHLMDFFLNALIKLLSTLVCFCVDPLVQCIK